MATEYCMVHSNIIIKYNTYDLGEHNVRNGAKQIDRALNGDDEQLGLRGIPI